MNKESYFSDMLFINNHYLNYLFTVLALFIIVPSVAQIQSTFHGGAKGQAMGNAYVAQSGTISLWGNPAGLSTLEQHQVSLYGSRPFGISDITMAAFGFSYRSNAGVFALTAQQQGFDDYKEQAFGLAYSRKLLPNLSLGGRIDVQRFDIAEYGNTQILTFDLGLRLEVFKGFHLGTHIYSPIEVDVTLESAIASLFSFGATYQVSEKVMLAGSIQKHQEYDPSINFGLEYLPAKNIFIRLGTSSQPTLVSFGLGFYLGNNLQLDFSSNYHQQLGFSPSIGINYSLGEN